MSQQLNAYNPSSSSTTYHRSMFSRRFMPPIQQKSDDEHEKPHQANVDAQLQRAKQFGHHFNQVSAEKVSAPLIAQRQVYIQREVIEEERKRDAQTQMKVQLKSEGELAGNLLQRSAAPDLTVRGNGKPLPVGVQRKMEKSFGSSFSDVRIHEGAQAKAVGALAYTQGSHIHFAPGQYQPDSASGQALLGHELTHVVQQRAGRVPAPTQTKGGVAINADPNLELEADNMGAKAARGEAAIFPGSGATLQQSVRHPPDPMKSSKRQPIQNSTQPVQMFFAGMLIGKIIPKVLEILFPDLMGGGGEGGAEGPAGEVVGSVGASGEA